MTAAAVIIAQALILAVAFGSAPDADPRLVWLVPAAALLAGGLTAFFHARGWHALMLAYIVGLVVGDVSALDIAREPVEGIFIVTSATVAFFAVLGLAVGVIAELVRLVHYLAHGGRVCFYPWGKKKEDKEEQ
jgi:hypothetical protein